MRGQLKNAIMARMRPHATLVVTGPTCCSKGDEGIPGKENLGVRATTAKGSRKTQSSEEKVSCDIKETRKMIKTSILREGALHVD